MEAGLPFSPFNRMDNAEDFLWGSCPAVKQAFITLWGRQSWCLRLTADPLRLSIKAEAWFVEVAREDSSEKLDETEEPSSEPEAFRGATEAIADITKEAEEADEAEEALAELGVVRAMGD
jgi:hypothetical protein